MEDWLREAKESAKIEAKCIIEDIVDTATEKHLEPNWYVEEVVNHINILKNKGIELIQTKAEESAKIEAKLIVKNMVDTATEKNLKPIWYAEEVIRNINDIKNEGIAKAMAEQLGGDIRDAEGRTSGACKSHERDIVERDFDPEADLEKIEMTEEQEAILNADMEAEMQRLEPYLYEV